MRGRVSVLGEYVPAESVDLADINASNFSNV